jgi:hypothetical protein
MCWCTDIMFFQNPPYMASQQLLIPQIAAVGTSFSPLPCQAWHGYGVTSAHRVEVEVGADEPASARPSGVAGGCRIMFKHMRHLGMPPTFVDTCEQLYGVFTTDYITPYGSTPSIDINRGTL